jgi:site-specific DNA-methyltransferase (adenine-specific)
LKILLDAIFGKTNFRNEIIWKRTSSHHNPRRWGPVHDTLLFYTRSDLYSWTKIFQEHDEKYVSGKYKYNDARGRYRLSDLTAAGVRHGDSGEPWRGFDPTPLGRHWGVPAIDVDNYSATLTTQQKLDQLDEQGFIYWTPGRVGKPGFPQFKRYLTIGLNIQDVVTDTPPINSMARERLGYPTQKPLALLERIVEASSNPGDLVLDPFCGCGTTIHAAQKLARAWIGIDITHLAISLIERRPKDAFPGAAFEVHGTPKDLESAFDLAARDKYQFQWWAVSLVDARPFGGKKTGADGGIDGILFSRSDKDKTEKALVSVKGGGNVGVGMVRDLIAVVEREKAAVGVLITLALPTRAMESEAAAAGFFQSPFESVPKIQIITLAELFHGVRPRIPRIDAAATFRAAAREKAETQGRLL